MSHLTAKFDRYHRENPQVWEGFVRFTKQLVDAGATKLSAKRVFERLRWESDIKGNDGYRLNNNYTAYYARMYEDAYPNDPCFTKRSSGADE